MITLILLLILFAVYILTILGGRKYKKNSVWKKAAKGIQALLWIAIAVLNWNSGGMLMRVLYGIIVVCSAADLARIWIRRT